MLDKGLLDLIVCPRDKFPLSHRADQLRCDQGHVYSIVDGVPILLVREMLQTHIEGERSLAVADAGPGAELPRFEVHSGQIDPFVNRAIGATNGSLYQHLVGNLREYPIPELRLPPGQGRSFVEIGCSWGRWCIAATRLGYRVVGIDPSLKSIRAAKRVAQQLGITAHYAVADGRCMPFPDRSFDQAFSYSVLQHLSRENVRTVLSEVRRVLHPNGGYRLQMPNAFGIRCIYHQARRHFRNAQDFEVRYWTPRELASVFSTALGSAQLSVDGFFSLNAQISDIRFLPSKYRALVKVSDRLRKLSQIFPPLLYAADSLYVTAA